MVTANSADCSALRSEIESGMNILLLAPHPFYQERGTPIAVDLLLQVLSKRGDKVDVVTYHEGNERSYAGVVIYRIPRLAWIHDIRPGFSWKKVVCDFFLMFKAFQLAAKKKYRVVHAVEESAFIAMLIRLTFGVPYIFDMDSSMPMQLTERTPILSGLTPCLRFFEALAVRQAWAVVAVCETLADTARSYHARRIYLLHDISLLSLGNAPRPSSTPQELSLNIEKPCLMYIGNLEPYQGIDLLLDCFAIILKSVPQAFLAIIGGSDSSIDKYKRKSDMLGIAARVRFFGPRPSTSMGQLFAEADVLVSPRMTGTNTPMKIYSYLQSGKPIAATDLPTHTQVLDHSTAMLAEPIPEKFAAGILQLLQDPPLCRRLVECAMNLAEKKYSFKVFAETLDGIYQQLESSLLEGK